MMKKLQLERKTLSREVAIKIKLQISRHARRDVRERTRQDARVA